MKFIIILILSVTSCTFGWVKHVKPAVRPHETKPAYPHQYGNSNLNGFRRSSSDTRIRINPAQVEPKPHQPYQTLPASITPKHETLPFNFNNRRRESNRPRYEFLARPQTPSNSYKYVKTPRPFQRYPDHNGL